MPSLSLARYIAGAYRVRSIVYRLSGVARVVRVLEPVRRRARAAFDWKVAAE